jgi:hypothetical protein
LIGVEPVAKLIEGAVYPRAYVLNRFIAKLIDLFIVVAADEVAPPVGFLSGLAYILIADGFAGGRSIGKRLVGLAQLLFAVPYVGWIGSAAVLAFESVLIVGNEHGRRLGDEVARTQVLDAGQLAVPD